MAKFISYQYLQEENKLADVVIGWNETNEEIAKKEAYNGEYEIFEDGSGEPEPVKDLEERTAALEEALTLLLEGATE